MKYVVLIYSNPTTWEEMPAAERDRAMSDEDDPDPGWRPGRDGRAVRRGQGVPGRGLGV
jgi:hypothetical protein